MSYIHLFKEYFHGYAWVKCGKTRGEKTKMTRNPAEVTCPKCKSIYKESHEKKVHAAKKILGI